MLNMLKGGLMVELLLCYYRVTALGGFLPFLCVSEGADGDSEGRRESFEQRLNVNAALWGEEIYISDGGDTVRAINAIWGRKHQLASAWNFHTSDTTTKNNMSVEFFLQNCFVVWFVCCIFAMQIVQDDNHKLMISAKPHAENAWQKRWRRWGHIKALLTLGFWHIETSNTSKCPNEAMQRWCSWVCSILMLYGYKTVRRYLCISAWGLVARFYRTGKFEDLNVWSE